jgi:hypothetical protein
MTEIEQFLAEKRDEATVVLAPSVSIFAATGSLPRRAEARALPAQLG